MDILILPSWLNPGDCGCVGGYPNISRLTLVVCVWMCGLEEAELLEPPHVVGQEPAPRHPV